jgi:hypothetical protein
MDYITTSTGFKVFLEKNIFHWVIVKKHYGQICLWKQATPYTQFQQNFIYSQDGTKKETCRDQMSFGRRGIIL